MIPGFAVDAALAPRPNRYATSVPWDALTDANKSGRVLPALLGRDSDTATDRRADCVEACRQLGLSATECGQRCNPTLGSTYQCKMQDNSVDSTLCNLGVWAWEGACIVDCKLLVGELPGVGPILDQVCTGVCHKIGDQMRATCPPKTICV